MISRLQKFIRGFTRQNFSKKKLGGFTLVELMVSMSIFTVFIVVVLGALLHLSKANERSQATLTAMDNIDAAIEQMARILKLGRDYYCDGDVNSTGQHDCPLGGTSVSFVTAEGERVVYEFVEIPDPSSGDARGEVVRTKRDLGGVRTSFAMTAPEIDVEKLSFVVIGSVRRPLDLRQPRINIFISGRTNIVGTREQDQALFRLQTLVSQRRLDIY